MQNECLKLAVTKGDIFACMPTSYGKSLVYEILPYLDDVFCQSKLSAVLVVTPLNAIIDEQIRKLGQLL